MRFWAVLFMVILIINITPTHALNGSISQRQEMGDFPNNVVLNKDYILKNHENGQYMHSIYSKIADEIINEMSTKREIEVIIKFKTENIEKAILNLHSIIPDINVITIHKFINAACFLLPSQYIPLLEDIPEIEYVASNRVVKIKNLNFTYDQEGYIIWENTSALLGVDYLWQQGINGTNVTIAIIDTGIDNTHKDLDDIDDNPTTNDTKVILFKDYVNNRDDLDPSDGMDAYDDNGHGTAVAGILAGTGYLSKGKFKGIAPAAKLIVIKVIDKEGNGDINSIIKGINFAVNHNANVISMSLGAEAVQYDPMLDAVENAIEQGIVVVAAAGNEGTGEGTYKGTISSPGVSLRVITVGASYANKFVFSWSSKGPTKYRYYPKPDIVAPGDYIITTKKNGTTYVDYPKPGSGYCRFLGTSASTPYVSGVVALLKQAYPDKDPLSLKLALMRGALNLNEDYFSQGAGLVNATAAYLLLSDNNTTLEYIAPNQISEYTMIFDDVAFSKIVLLTNNQSSIDLNCSISGNITLQLTFSNFTRIFDGYFGISISHGEINYTNIGYYEGTVNINTNFSHWKIPINYSILKYSGRILFDVYHQDSDDYDSPYYYLKFVDMFWRLGFEANINDKKITREILNTVDVLVIADEEEEFTDDEIDAINDWIASGGVLLTFVDFYDSESQQSYFDVNSFEKLTSNYGIRLSRHSLGIGPSFYGDDLGLIYGQDTGGSVVPHPITEDVQNIYLLYGTSFFIQEGDNTKGLIWANTTDNLLVLTKAGKGEIIAGSDASILFDEILDDARAYNADNYYLLENIARYTKPTWPVIYYLNLEKDDINGKVTLTAYIFDDKSTPTVTLAMKHWFTNNWENRTLSPRDNYIYYAELDTNPLNMYDAYLVITDSDGNIRTIVLNVTYYIYLPILLMVVGFLGVIILLVFLYFLRRHRKNTRPRMYDEEGEFFIIYPE